MALSRYLSRDEFEHYLSVVSKLFSFDPAFKKWKPNASKIASYTPEEVRQIVDELRRIGMVGPELDEALRIAENMGDYAYELSGNYIKLRARHLPLDSIRSELSYEIKTYDRELHKQVTRRIYRVWGENPVVTYRGLAPILERVSGRPLPKLFEVQTREVQVHGFEPRKYQLDAMKSITTQFEKCGAATIQMATGGGKTVVAKLVHESLNRPKTFFVTLSTDLLLQAKEVWEKFGDRDVGLVMSGSMDYSKNTVMATVQTLNKVINESLDDSDKQMMNELASEGIRYDDVELNDEDRKRLLYEYSTSELVIFDETQHVPASTVRTVVKYNDTSLRLGLSATPWRDDGRSMDIYAFMGTVAHVTNASDLADMGYVVPADITMYHVDHSYTPVSWPDAKSHVFASEDRAKRVAEIVRSLPKPCMVIVKEIKHGRLQSSLIDGSIFVSSEVTPELRKSIFDRVRSNEQSVIVCTTLADEGLDIPNLRSLVLAGGGKSSTRALQRVGRVLRPDKGKDYGYVVDIVDDIEYFDEHAERRRKIYQTEPRWRIHDE